MKGPRTTMAQKKLLLKRKNKPSESKNRRGKAQVRKRIQKNGFSNDSATPDGKATNCSLRKSARTEYMYDETPNFRKTVFVDEECKSELLNRKLIVRIERILLEDRLAANKRNLEKKQSESSAEKQKEGEDVPETPAAESGVDLSIQSQRPPTPSKESATDCGVRGGATETVDNRSEELRTKEKELLVGCRDCAFRDINAHTECPKNVPGQTEEEWTFPSPETSTVAPVPRSSVIMSTRVWKPAEQETPVYPLDPFMPAGAPYGTLSPFSTVNWDTGQVHIQSYAQMNASNPAPNRTLPSDVPSPSNYAQHAGTPYNFVPQTDLLSNYLRHGRGANFMSPDCNATNFVSQLNRAANFGGQASGDAAFGQRAQPSANFLHPFRGESHAETHKPIATRPSALTSDAAVAPEPKLPTTRASEPFAPAFPMPKSNAPPYFVPQVGAPSHAHGPLASNFLLHNTPTSQPNAAPGYLSHSNATPHYLTPSDRGPFHYPHPHSSYQLARTTATPHPSQYSADPRYSRAHLQAGFGPHHVPKTTSAAQITTQAGPQYVPQRPAADSRIMQVAGTPAGLPKTTSASYLLPQTQSASYQMAQPRPSQPGAPTVPSRQHHAPQSGAATPHLVPETVAAFHHLPQGSSGSRAGVPQVVPSPHRPGSASPHVPQSGRLPTDSTAGRVPHAPLWSQTGHLPHLGFDPFGISGFAPPGRRPDSALLVPQTPGPTNQPQPGSETPSRPPPSASRLPPQYYGRNANYLSESQPAVYAALKNNYFVPHSSGHNGQPLYPDPGQDRTRVDPRFSVRPFSAPQELYGFPSVPHDPAYYEVYNRAGKQVPAKPARAASTEKTSERQDPRLYRKNVRTAREGTAENPISIAGDAERSLTEIGAIQPRKATVTNRRGRHPRRTEGGARDADKVPGGLYQAAYRPEVPFEQSVNQTSNPSRMQEPNATGGNKVLKPDLIYEACRLVFLEETSYQEATSEKSDSPQNSSQPVASRQISSED